MNHIDAIEAELRKRDEPIVTEYELHRIGLTIHDAGDYQGKALKRRAKRWDASAVRNAVRGLERRKALVADRDFGAKVWRVLVSSRSGSAEEVACIADPFCYVSHLSAMQRYGLTDRSPAALHLTTPARAVWAALRDEKIARDFPQRRIQPAPLNHMRLKDTLRDRPVVMHESSRPATPIGIRGEATRIATIGRTFLDMLSEPALCGGMRHVLAIWDHEAADWLEDIILEIDAFDVKLVKVRAGYILSERLGLSDARIDAWTRFAQRGGSQKLDPDSPYASVYSERWMLSLNA